MKKVIGDYGSNKTRISVNLNSAWDTKYFDYVNKSIAEGMTAQDVFVKAVEKVVDEDDVINRLKIEMESMKKWVAVNFIKKE